MARRLSIATFLASVVFACAVAPPPPPSAEVRLAIATSVIQADGGDWVAALATLESAIASEPASNAAAIEAGIRLSAMGDLARAVVMFDTASQRQPRDPRPLLELARMYRANGRPENADRSIDAAAAIDERDPTVALELARLRITRDQLWPAADAVGAARAGGVDSAEAIYLFAKIEAGRQATGEALVQFQRALKVDPGHVGATVALAELLRQSDRNRDAIAVLAALETRVSRMPAIALQARFDAFTARGDLEKADLARVELSEADSYEQLVAELRDRLWLAPEDPVLRRQLGEMLAEAGEKEAAVGLFHGWSRLRPDEMEPLIAIASVSEVAAARAVLTRGFSLKGVEPGVRDRALQLWLSLGPSAQPDNDRLNWTSYIDQAAPTAAEPPQP